MLMLIGLTVKVTDRARADRFSHIHCFGRSGLAAWGPIALGLVLSLQSCTGQAGSPLSANDPARTLAVIVNQADPLSQQIGEYYQAKRLIPAENMILIRFPPQRTTLTPGEFQMLKAQVDAKTPTHIQGYALTWTAPYRVGCMSITAAFALGFDPKYCAESCQPTAINPYFNQNSVQPFKDFGLRPTIALAASTWSQAKALIDRGMVATANQPGGTAYLLTTRDRDRNVRASLYPSIQQQLAPRFPIRVIAADALQDKSDVMFYFTGISQVSQLKSNRFLPGAIADHLTSFGGMLTDSHQMSSLRWLEAGATGSYGTVVEPCNFPQKFPHPGVVMYYYLRGETLLQAYWKGVQQPGQGIFIGDPLARPFAVKE
jgi:uncharacterized protein (TIGR03790 family)